MSRAEITPNHDYIAHVDVKNLSLPELELLKDGLATLLAALPAQHTSRPEVIDLIDTLRRNS